VSDELKDLMLIVVKDTLLNQVDGLQISKDRANQTLPYAIEAAWVTGKWEKLRKYLESPETLNAGFNVGLGQAFLALHLKKIDKFDEIIGQLRAAATGNLSTSNTASLQACHETMLRLHVLTEVEMISGTTEEGIHDRNAILRLLDRRLEVVGAFLSDKQYLLGIRRATMQLSRYFFRLARFQSSQLTQS
jgi:serine/threonine-protein kinase ATR